MQQTHRNVSAKGLRMSAAFWATCGLAVAIPCVIWDANRCDRLWWKKEYSVPLGIGRDVSVKYHDILQNNHMWNNPLL